MWSALLECLLQSMRAAKEPCLYLEPGLEITSHTNSSAVFRKWCHKLTGICSLLELGCVKPCDESVQHWVCALWKTAQGHPWTLQFCRRSCGPHPTGSVCTNTRGFLTNTRGFLELVTIPRQVEKWAELWLRAQGWDVFFVGAQMCPGFVVPVALWITSPCCHTVLGRAGFDKNGNTCLWVERLFHLWLYLFCCSLSWADTLGQKICWFSLFSALALYWRALTTGDALGCVIPARWLCSVWHFGECCPAWW